MERIQVLNTIQAAEPRFEWHTEPADVYEPNFGLLAPDDSWRKSWSAIVAGRFSSSPYSGLLFVEESTSYAELYMTDGSGRIIAPAVGVFDPLGGRPGWSHIVPGYFGDSGFTGLLLYNHSEGTAQFLESDGAGQLHLIDSQSGWRTSWSHIVSGRFDASSPYSGLFFYSASENYAEIWATNGHGLAGSAPVQTLSGFSKTTFTHIVGADFHWTPGFIDQVPTLTDVFCYDAITGRGEMYRCDLSPDGSSSTLVTPPSAQSDELPKDASALVAGNFGGAGNSDLAFYTGPSGMLSFYSFQDSSDNPSAEIVLNETQTGLRSTVALVVPGTFWQPNEEDHKFADGPSVVGSPPYDANWRFGTGGFTDLLLYDRTAGLGLFYFHEPLSPPPVPLDGYLTSQTTIASGSRVATGSVLPGESIDFHVSSQCGAYAITIYQQGAFEDGTTERSMATLDGLPTAPAPYQVSRTAYRDGAEWPIVATFTVPDWPTGLYLARVKAVHGAPEVDLPFVVRAPGGVKSRILLALADTTFQAYNDWGGRNLYGNVSGANFAGAFPSASAYRVPFGLKLSFERPFHGGFGNAVQSWEMPFIQWLSRRNIPFDVCSARDLHFGELTGSPYRLILFAGHHEYWTAPMRTNVETYVRAGGNAAFFSGNVCWWQIRLTTDGKQLICYKVDGLDPLSVTADHALTTGHWFSDLVQRPETELTGVSWLGNDGVYSDDQHRFTVKQAGHWALAWTGLKNGDLFGEYPGEDGNPAGTVAGSETDRVQHGGANGLDSPPDYTVASIYDLVYPTLEVGTMGSFSPASGTGVVFNAATTNWALGLSPDRTSWNTIDQITANVIAKLGECCVARPWSSVSEGSTKPGAPVTAVVTAPGEVSLFLADPQGGVYTASGSAVHGWGPWSSVSEGSTKPGAPVTAVVTAPGEVSLFLADPQGGVYTASGSAVHGWGPWSSVSEGSTKPGAPVTAVVTAPGEVSLFLADPQGGVYTASGSAVHGWGPWSSVSEGSTKPGAPVTAVVTAPGEVSLFLADPQGGVYTASGSAVHGWGPWSSVSEGSTKPGAPVTAVVTAPGEVSLFLADPQGGVYTASGSAVHGWGPWSSVSEGSTKPGAPVTAVVTAPGEVSLFLADPQGGVYTASGSAVHGWGPWSSVSEGSTKPGAPVTAVVTAPGEVSLFLADRGGAVYMATEC